MCSFVIFKPQILDAMESIYNRHPVICSLYAPGISMNCLSTLSATAYVMDESKMDHTRPTSLPSERYLDIIALVCFW